jgi:hypothetical protein
MLHERPDESFHWKNKLEQLDHLPTEPAADKGELWKRLHARLSKKPNKTKPGWYWTAAACVLLGIGISWFFVDGKTSKPVAEKRLPLPQQSSNKDIAISSESSRVDTQHINVIAKESKKGPVIVNNKKGQLARVLMVAKKDDVSNPPDASDSSHVSDQTTFRPPDTVSSNSVAAIPNRRRLRVIHINDLEKQSESEVKYAGTGLPSAQRKNTPHKGISAFSLGRNTSDDIVKIKLSPSN